MKKLLLSLFLVASLSFVSVANADTASSLQAQIDAILAQIKQIQAQINAAQNPTSSNSSNTSSVPGSANSSNTYSSSSDSAIASCYSFNNNLRVGDSGVAVGQLQAFLSREGFSIPDGESPQKDGQTLADSRFGEGTAAAVVDFQSKYGIIKTGYVGPITRAKINGLYSCGNNVNSKPTISNVAGKAAGNFEIDAGGYISISGKGFLGGSNLKVYLAGQEISIVQSSDSYIYAKAPTSLVPGSYYNLYVVNQKGTSNVVSVKVLSTVVTDNTSNSNKPTIKSIYPASGPVGTIIEISGTQLNGFEGDLDAWIENDKGEVAFLPGLGPTPRSEQVIRVKISSSLCKTNNSYSGAACSYYLTITPGNYKIYTKPWGVKSNVVNFTVTSTATSTQPYITEISPTQVKQGQQFTIYGSGFLPNVSGSIGSTAVMFSPTPAVMPNDMGGVISKENIAPAYVSSDGTKIIVNAPTNLSGDYYVFVDNIDSTGRVRSDSNTKKITIMNVGSTVIPTVSFTVSNGTKTVTSTGSASSSEILYVNVGDNMKYSWNTNGTRASSGYTLSGGDDTCGWYPSSYGSKYPWVANTTNGSYPNTTSEYVSAQIKSCQAGHTYYINYTGTNDYGSKSATVAVYVNPVAQVTPVVPVTPVSVSDVSILADGAKLNGPITLTEGKKYTISWNASNVPADGNFLVIAQGTSRSDIYGVLSRKPLGSSARSFEWVPTGISKDVELKIAVESGNSRAYSSAFKIVPDVSLPASSSSSNTNSSSTLFQSASTISVSPSYGPAGSTVKVTVPGYNQTLSYDDFIFGSYVPENFKVLSGNEVSFTVPKSAPTGYYDVAWFSPDSVLKTKFSVVNNAY